MKYGFLAVSLFVLIFIVGFNTVDAKPTPKLVSSSEEITVITNIPTFESKTMTLEIINTGNGTANFTNYIYTDLLLTEENTFSNLDSVIPKSNIESTVPLPKSLKPQDSALFTWIINSDIQDEGTYTGRIFINGSNFDIVPVKVNVTYTASPWNMLQFSFAGLVIAIIIGSTYEFYERKVKSKKNVESSYLSTFDTLFDTVDIIFRMVDQQKKTSAKNHWVRYKTWLEKSITTMEEEIQDLSLSKKSSGYTSFKQIVDLFAKNSEKLEEEDSDRELLPYPMNSKMTKILKENNLDNVQLLNEYLKKYDKEKKIKFIDELLSAESNPDISNYIERVIQGSKNKNPKHKILYFFATSVVSSISALLVIDTFTGPYFLNALIAGALGFGIYRSKDFTKLFKSE